MKNLVLVCVVAFAISTTAMAGDIAISTQAGWFGQDAADREAQEIVDNVTAVPVELFAADQQDALADWVVAHTGNGAADLLILCGQFPNSIYPAGNAEPDGSVAELFLDAGNIIVNTGDWIFYVCSAGNNGPSGLQNMMDIPGVTVAGEDNTAVAVTADGQAITPSLQDFQTDRPFHLDTLEGAWYPELVLAQNPDGTRADPVIVGNAETGGRIGIFYQTAGQDDDPRGEVISEWINNWYLTAGDVPNPPASNPNPADGAIDADVAALEWTAGYGAVSHNVYLSSDATIDDADLLGGTELTLQVVIFDPGATYYWRVDEVDADGGVIEGPVWSFSTLPLEAHFPSPADGATNAISLELSWTPGKNTIMHNVSYGTDPAMLLPVSMMQMGTTYDPGALASDTTYYWRVDEFTPAGTVTGPVWSFSTIGLVTAVDVPGLIAGYQFEEDASSLSALDMSVNALHGSLLGDASIADGALVLDGNGDCVDIGNDPIFNPAGSFSISAFVNMHSWGGSWGNAIIGKRGESNIGWQLRRHSGNQNLTFTLRGTTGADDPQGSITPPLNEWIHVAAVYDAEGGTRSVYIDGALDVQIADTGVVATADQNVYIGARASGGNTPEAFFDGDIDDVLVYSRALTIEEIRATAGVEALPWSPDPADGATGLSSSAVLSWNPGVGAVEQDVYLGTDKAAVADANASDATGIYRGRQAEATFAPDDLVFNATHYWRVDQIDADGNIVAGPVWSFSVAPAIPMDNWLAAAIGAGAAYVDTFVVDGVYDIGALSGDITYEFIVRSNPDETEASMALIGRRGFGDTTVGLKYEQWNNTGTYGATVFGVADYDYGVATNPGVDTHLVFVSSEAAGTTDLYVDGALAGSVPTAITLSGIVGIGYGASAEDGSEWFDNFDGNIFGIAIYDRALTAEEIAASADVFSLADVTAPGDLVQGVPNDGDWPGGEIPDFAFDDDSGTKYLHFKGGSMTTGVQVQPASGPSVVTGLTLTTANDAAGRDPATFELSGSNDSLDGPYTVIASGDVVDFVQAAEWPRFTKNATGIFFANDVAYKYYQIVFPTVRGDVLMQIGEIELLGVPAPVARWEFDGDLTGLGGLGETGTAIGVVGFEDDPIMGQVLSLPGGDDQYVALGSVGISGNMPKTITCWAKADNTNIPDWTLIFGFTGDADAGGGNGSHFNIGSLGGPGGVGAHCWGWEETMFSDDEALEWHHYAMTYDGTTIQYYGDGVLMDSDEAKSNVRDLSASADRVHAGSRITQASSFPGKVDDARVYMQALSAGQIAKIATAPAGSPPVEGKTVSYDFEAGAQGWGGLKDGTAPTVVDDGGMTLRVTIDEDAHAQQEAGWAGPRDFTVDDALGGISTLSFWYRIDHAGFNGGNFVLHWIMSNEAWSGGGWYGNGLWGVVIADGQWHQQTVDLSILGADAGGWEGAWGDEAAWAFRDDLLYSFEIAVSPTDGASGSNMYLDDVVFE